MSDDAPQLPQLLSVPPGRGRAMHEQARVLLDASPRLRATLAATGDAGTEIALVEAESAQRREETAAERVRLEAH